jgi:DMSO/TMAO reductase YedYZ heme-binding membrane subunit
MAETTKKNTNPAWKIIFWTFAFSLVYAVLRYHIFGPVPWERFPFFILNKIISLCSFILLAFNFTFGPLKNLGLPIPNSWLRSRRIIGIVGFMMVFAHVLISFMLFTPAIFGKFFTPEGTIKLIAGISMITGILAFMFLWIYNISFNSNFRKDKDLLNWINSRKVLFTAFLLGGAHLFFMGYKGWLAIDKWEGGMPPISLIAFSFFLIGFIINLFGREEVDM